MVEEVRKSTSTVGKPLGTFVHTHTHTLTARQNEATL